ncbi:unnamed protein product [Prunus armeniaca]
MSQQEAQASPDVIIDVRLSALRNDLAISGMNWLAKHRVLVDCFRKDVIFHSPEQPEVTFYGECRVLPSCLISAMTAR